MKFRILIIIFSLILGSIITFAENNPNIIITEINHLPTDGVNWIEIWNNTSNSLDITEIKFIKNEIPHSITHPTRTEIAPDEIIIITNQIKEIPGIEPEQIFNSSWENLMIDGEEIGIQYEEETIDQIIYPAINAETDSANSLHRISTSTFELAAKSPLITDLSTTDSPAPQSNYLALITEVSPNSSNDFIELYFKPVPNTELNLKDWSIIDNKTIHTFFEQIISTETYVTLELPLTKTNENIILLNSEDQIIDAVCWHSNTPSQAELADYEDLITAHTWENNCIPSEPITTNTSIGRTSFFDTNTLTDWDYFSKPTPSQTNEHKNSSPIANIAIESGKAINYEKVKLNLTGATSSDPDDDQLNYTWFLNQESWNEKANPAELTITEIGSHKIELIVTDSSGANSKATLYAQVDPPLEPIKTPVCPDVPKPTITSSTTTDSPTPAKQDTSWWSQIAIHSFLANPEGSDTNNEWIKLINNSDQTVTLNDWQLDDQEGGSKPFTITNLTIPPKETVQISNKDSRISLNNNGDELRLFTPDNQLAASISYDKANEGQVLPDNQTQPVQSQASNAANPTITPVQTKLVNSTVATNSPKAKTTFKNGTTSTELKITEILPNPKGADQGQEWLEIYNPTTTPLNLGSWKLTVNSKEYILSDEIIIPANTYFQLNQDKTNFTLTNSETTIQLFNFNNELSDTVTYTQTKEDHSFSLITNTHTSTNTWEWTSALSPGQPNPEIVELNGTTNSKLFTQNQLLIKTASNHEQIVEFTTGQISSEQLQLLQNEHQIKITALQTGNKLSLEQILNLTPLNSKTPTKFNYLPLLIPLLIIIFLLLYKPCQSYLKKLVLYP